MNLSVQLAPNHPRGLRLANPVMTASGTFGYGTEYAALIDIQRLGAIVCKGTTLKPRPGNPQPRVVETTSGMLNSIGLQNVGVEALVAEKAPVWSTWRVPVIVNIAGDAVNDYAALAGRLEGIAGVSGIEVNVSCPNTAAGGVHFGKDPKMVSEVTRAVRRATSLPVIVKLTPNVTDICEVAVAAVESGADALSLINTLSGMAIDARKRKPVLGNINGGLSGPAIKPVALHMVYRVARVVKAPIIGIGGIVSGMDAIEFIEAGATAVQVGMASFVNPRSALDVLEELEAFLVEEGIEDVNSLVGAAL